jgi:hypothetical protein
MFGHARNALKHGLQLMETKQEAAALLPEFVCEAVAQPFRALGIGLQYYRTDKSMAPVWEDVNRLVGPRTRVLVMVNYFGNHQDVEKFKEFATSKNLLLVEDSAHGAFGEIHGEPVGTVGDIGIVSERKIVGTETGASLFIDGVPIPAPTTWPIASRRRRSTIKLMIVNNRENFLIGPVISKGLNMINELRVRGRLVEPVQAHVQAHPEDVTHILSQNRTAVRRRRRELWAHVNDRVRQVPGLTPVFDELSDGSNPWAYPFRMNDRPSRINTLALQHKLQLPIRMWPIFPHEVRHLGSVRGGPAPLLMIPLDSTVTLRN